MNLFNSIRAYLHLGATISEATTGTVVAVEKRLFCAMKKEALQMLTLNAVSKGVTEKTIAERPVIVSLTTHGKRLYEVPMTIESIMQGTIKPNRIILWLDKDVEEKPLPVLLEKQKKRGLEVLYNQRNIRSFTKLIPTLRLCPDAIIVTIDDDMFYQPDMLEGLLKVHQIYPDDVLANRVDTIVLGSDGKPLTCLKWNLFQKPVEPSPLNVALGVEGVLYPPNSFDEEVLNEDVFMSICPTADDLWFKAMELKAGTKVRHVYTHYEKGGGAIPNLEVQDIGLQYINENVNDVRNDIQLNKVLETYDLFDRLM